MSANDDWILPWEGGCRCGQVRFRISQAPLVTGVCHCAGCQRMTGSAFSLGLSIPTPGFEVTQGEPVRGGLQLGLDHRHCDFCKSWVFTRFPEMPHFVNVRATMLDDPTWVVPFVETFTREKLGWVSTPAAHSYDKVPEISEWETLIADFRERGSRPRASG